MAQDDETEALRAEVEQLRASVELLREELNHAKRRRVQRTVRYQSTTSVLGMPLISVALGPDEQSGAARGHAKGIIAVGDIASGVLALGGISSGVIAIGGARIKP